jgi:hypothetical protein
MDEIDERILKRFDEMIALGREVLATRKEPAPGHITSAFVDVQRANQWFTSSLSLVSRAIGEDSEHYAAMKRHFTDYPKYPNAQQAFGALLAAQDDFKTGALFQIKALIAAEVFDEFLEQAEALHAAGYFGPAAVIAGAVLEDALRKICTKQNIELPEKPKLDWMNARLAKSGAFNLLTQKKITALADIRNSAAHGQWDAFDSSDVAGIIEWTRDFMQRNFG